MTWWQVMIGLAEMAVAFWVTRWLCHPDHRAERLAFFTRRPKLRKDATITEHLKWIAEQDAKPKRGGRMVTAENGRDYRLPEAHACVRCRRMGSLGIYVIDVGGWLCIHCVNEHLPEKTRVWQQQQLQYRQENGVQYWESGVFAQRPKGNQVRWDTPVTAWFSLCVTGKDGRPLEATERQVIDRWPRQTRGLVYHVRPGHYDWVARSENRDDQPVEYCKVHCAMEAVGDIIVTPSWIPNTNVQFRTKRA